MQMPTRKEPEKLPPFTPSPKIFQVQKEAEKWGEMMGVSVVGELNEKISKGKMQELLLISEALQEGRISKIAEQIIERGGVKFVMIAGPSSSGKTTFSHRLSIQLAAHGMKPHPIAVDNYFVNREDTPRDENGNYNYECLEAIDVELFNRDMNALLKGERVELPRFNFKLGKREYKGDFLQMQPNDILVIEGIHGLNDRLSYSLPTESKFKIYISALTQLNIDEHNRIPTTDGRLIRRIVRDNRTRGTSAKATIAMWPSVRRGEDENIFPYQEQADAMFNSALLYELAVLKLYAEPVLFQIGPDEPEYQEAKRLLKFLDYFDIVMPEVARAQAFGRIGCFLAGCCYGRPTDSVFGVVFPEDSLAPAGIKLIPTQLISAAGDFAIAIILIILADVVFKKAKESSLKAKTGFGMVSGDIGCIYMFLYGIGRFLVEFLRNDVRGTVGNLSTSQFISLFIVAGSIILYVINHKKASA